jgi:hypothetical protein
MEDIAKTELGRQAFEIMSGNSDRESGLTQLQSLSAEATTSEERQEIQWAIEGFLLNHPPQQEVATR